MHIYRSPTNRLCARTDLIRRAMPPRWSFLQHGVHHPAQPSYARLPDETQTPRGAALVFLVGDAGFVDLVPHLAGRVGITVCIEGGRLGAKVSAAATESPSV